VQSYHCTSSLGIAVFDGQHGAGPDLSGDELMKRADTAMYHAKRAGRNTFRIFDDTMQQDVATRARLSHDLHEANRLAQFVLHFQPQVDRDGHTTGAEALIRWRHPERGLVEPAGFIAEAEASGLIMPIGLWVLEAACAQLAAWRTDPATAHLTLSVNVSARQFRQPQFVAQTRAVLGASGIDPRRLKLELTESLLLDDVEDTIIRMAALQQTGVSFSLDDFGTGYSSLAYLKRLPIDQLKIDRAFVRDILDDPSDAAIATTILTLAGTLGLAVIAEGVETAAQRDFLLSQGCQYFQGFLFSEPLPLSAFEQYVRATPVR
jgi:EAL domain-containing protein (putative c-di-GMP-specific phosphodiesterase class I)